MPDWGLGLPESCRGAPSLDAGDAGDKLYESGAAAGAQPEEDVVVEDAEVVDGE